jgi:hypothetical protein
MVVGGLLTQPPTRYSAVIVVWGLFAVVLGTQTDGILDRVAKFSGFGVELQTRESGWSVQSDDAPGDSSRATARYIVGRVALEELLTVLRDDLEGCRAQVFLYDAATELLGPAHTYGDTSDVTPRWKARQGVIGVAFAERRYRCAGPTEMVDPVWGLDAVTERWCKPFTAWAAAPLYGPDGEVVGVLSLSSEHPDQQLLMPYGYREHLDLAERVAVCLTELMSARR